MTDNLDLDSGQEFTSDPKIYRRLHGLKQSPRPSQFTTLKETLGKGSMATISLVLDTKSRTVGALKVFKRNKAGFADQELAVFRVAHVSPFLLRCLDAFKDKSTPILLTEFAPFGTLDELTSRTKGLGCVAARVYALEIALAVDFLHQHLILHRDVKPANVFVLLSGHVTLADFDMAYHMTSPRDTPSHICATYVTRPPEVWSNEEYSFPVDVWQMGITFYNIISNRWPYFHANVATQRTDVRSGNPIPLHGDTFTPDVADLISEMLRAEPSHRIPSSRVPKHRYFNDLTKPYQPPISPSALMALMKFSEVESQVVRELMKEADERCRSTSVV